MSPVRKKLLAWVHGWLPFPVTLCVLVPIVTLIALVMSICACVMWSKQIVKYRQCRSHKDKPQNWYQVIVYLLKEF